MSNGCDLCGGKGIVKSLISHETEPCPRCDHPCAICGRPQEKGGTVPLCKPCRETAQAHARQERARREWEAEGVR